MGEYETRCHLIELGSTVKMTAPAPSELKTLDLTIFPSLVKAASLMWPRQQSFSIGLLSG